VVGAALVLVSALPAAGQGQVQLRIQDGRVNLVAKEATLRQILAEWARVGQTRIVNGERVPGGALSLELVDVPEKQALDIVLRSVTGYVAAPRPTPTANASRYDRILVMPAPAQARTTVAASSAPPPLPQPRVQPFPVERDFDLPPAVQRPVVTIPNPPPAPPLSPGPAPAVAPVMTGAPTTTMSPSGAPVGASAPGVVLQPPTTPTSPAASPVRR
jgi:hypothetical protein